MPAEEIGDEDLLHRRLAPGWVDAGVVSSAAFKFNGKPDGEISVDLARLRSVEETLSGRPTFGLGRLIAGFPRTLDFKVIHDPCPATDPENYAHSLISGENTRAKCRLLATNTLVVVEPRRR